ncbi:hypothetical protein ACFY12_17415 [Streptomyces sp. NPDC001339]|uniref:hypothetical protein n=1 Tax=Streptomyces sp. NPDC001339 TaxID=3364563 RepID=UPI0036BE555F
MGIRDQFQDKANELRDRAQQAQESAERQGQGRRPQSQGQSRSRTAPDPMDELREEQQYRYDDET